MPNPSFRLNIQLIDPSGRLDRVALFGHTAEAFLGCQVYQPTFFCFASLNFGAGA